MDITNTAHFIMQSKGGAGKSVVGSILAQYLKEFDKDVILIDTDPSNKTLGSFEGLDVEKIEVLNKHKLIDQSKFDGFMNKFIESDKSMLVDTGSGDFLAINSYMIQNEIPSIFEELGKKLIIHVPINFGQAKAETVKCLVGLASNHPNTSIVIWENEFFGENSEDLANAPIMDKYSNIAGIIKIRKMTADTEEKDFSQMLNSGLTFEEVAESKDFGFIEKTRIKRIKKEVWEQLDVLFDVLSVTEQASEAEQKPEVKKPDASKKAK